MSHIIKLNEVSDTNPTHSQTTCPSKVETICQVKCQNGPFPSQLPLSCESLTALIASPLPSTGNEKYERFLEQAKKNMEKEYNKYESVNHYEMISEDNIEEENTEVRAAPPCTECL